MPVGVPGQRVVLLRSPLPNGKYRIGTGTLIGERLVLTAAHVVFDGSGLPLSKIQVWPSQQAALLAGSVIWPERYQAHLIPGRGMDAALVEIDSSYSAGPKSTVSFGRMTGRAAGVPCEAIGYPRVLRDPDGLRIDDHISGFINPGSGVLAGRHDINITSAVPTSPAEDGAVSPWSGASGAGVFVDGLLTAVLVVDLPGFPHDRLTAVPVHRLFADRHFRNVLAAQVAETDAWQDVKSVELSHLLSHPRSTPKSRRSPATLLRADQEVAPFRSRDTELSSHVAWCRDPRSGLEIRLVRGPGGQGKTRFARQLVHTMTEMGWLAGFIRADSPAQILDLSPLADTSSTAVPGVLLVVDYAETRTQQLGRLLRLLWNAVDTAPVRVLLLARTEGDWWRDLRLYHPDALDTSTTSTLPPLDDTLSARRQAYDRAVAAFAAALFAIDAGTDWQDLAAQVTPPEDLDADRYGSPLTLQMSALLALLQARDESTGGPETFSQEKSSSPLEQLMDHEQRYWNKTAVEYGIALHSATLAITIAAATLLGAGSADEARETLARLPGLRDQPEDRLMAVDRWLIDLYPATAGSHWGALEPDRLAEHHIGALAAEDQGLVDLLLSGASDRQAANALVMLKRAISHQRHLSDQLRDVLARRRARLERIAVIVAAMAKDPSLSLASAMDTVYEAVSREDRRITWEQWLESERGETE